MAGQSGEHAWRAFVTRAKAWLQYSAPQFHVPSAHERESGHWTLAFARVTSGRQAFTRLPWCERERSLAGR